MNKQNNRNRIIDIENKLMTAKGKKARSGNYLKKKKCI